MLLGTILGNGSEHSWATVTDLGVCLLDWALDVDYGILIPISALALAGYGMDQFSFSYTDEKRKVGVGGGWSLETRQKDSNHYGVHVWVQS